MENNTIILLKGYRKLTNREYEKFEKGNTIWGDMCEPEEIKRWPIEEKEAAQEELAKYRCEYNHGYDWDITEYALEYCVCDEDGEFYEGSDFDLAEEE